MGRREQRHELQSTWSVYEAHEPGRPFRKKDLEDADGRASLGEPMSPGALIPLSKQTRESVNGTLQRLPSELHVLGILGRGSRRALETFVQGSGPEPEGAIPVVMRVSA